MCQPACRHHSKPKCASFSLYLNSHERINLPFQSQICAENITDPKKAVGCQDFSNPYDKPDQGKSCLCTPPNKGASWCLFVCMIVRVMLYADIICIRTYSCVRSLFMECCIPTYVCVGPVESEVNLELPSQKTHKNINEQQREQ